MTSVTFHVNVTDRQDYACRLARKALASNTRTVMVVDAQDLDALSDYLWAASDTDFLAHCSNNSPPSVRERSRLTLTPALHPGMRGQVLVNLAAVVSDACDSFDRVIEIVGTAETERSAARVRWRHYCAAGHHPSHFDANSRTASP